MLQQKIHFNEISTFWIFAHGASCLHLTLINIKLAWLFIIIAMVTVQTSGGMFCMWLLLIGLNFPKSAQMIYDFK